MVRKSFPKECSLSQQCPGNTQFILKVFYHSISMCGYCQKPPIFHLPITLQF